ncbi:ankyrin unc44 [Colletotrichum sojae]|uniref:Ankyrin unc44 n=1 Tax=Colletotrichum sojae TaxID=2175907 RepID=A0A8H6INL3_9PEZI|nr:ankyrin unc44 [Colletotrichum sojae]
MATTSTPRLETMPAEIILAIAADDALQKSLNNLCLVSKRFHAILNRELYSAAVKKEIPEITAIAARDGNLDTLKLAAAHGADLNSAKWVPFPTWAADDEDDGDDGDDGDDDGVPENYYPWATPLHLAAAEGQYEVVKWLVSQHVNLEEPGRLFCRCQSVAETYNSPTKNSTDSYLEDNEQVEYKPPGIWTPLHFAICRGHLSVARFLLQQGASHDVRHVLDLRQVWNKTSAIHCAAASGQQMILKCILDNGVDINTPDGVGANVLHYALNSSDVDTVAYVLAKGANLATPITITKSGGDGEDTEVVVQNAVEWLYAKCFDEPFFVSDALDVLSQHGAPFWQWEGGSATSRKVMTALQLVRAANSTHPQLLQAEFNGWVAAFIRGALARYTPNADFAHLDEQILALFWTTSEIPTAKQICSRQSPLPLIS